ncbi:tape measure protein [Bacillus sp. JCM 19034]|uniref:tape measure protein n=1 Tax=Bacillus sp. JCM 19034 TaxID=1481928 RepID=UPI0007837E4F|nr:tape measure protein [Bacillus sp. JCM 19034]
MSDGVISIAIEVDGKQVNVASKELDNLESSGYKAGDGTKQAEDGLKGVNQEAPKAGNNVKKFATALGLVAIGAAAFKTLKASMDDAIKRFDTLNQFPKVLQALGVSAEDSERAMERLSDGIEGLPTKLDEIASTAQRMYTSFNDMDKASDSAIALNNALLGSGASADEARRGTEQYLQALQTGNMDMQQWRTLQETMDVGLIKIAESFGFAGKSAKDDLYQALQDGTITMDLFNDKLIEVGTGTGIMAQLAKENSLGLATSLQNVRTAIARGVADMIQRFDRLSKEVTGKDIAQNIDSLKHITNASFQAIGNAIDRTTPFVKAFASGVQATLPVVKALSPALIAMATAYAMHAVIGKTITVIKTSNAVISTATTLKKLATAAMNLYTTSIKGNTAATLINATQTKIMTVALAAKTAVIKASSLAMGVMTGAISAATAVKTIATAASYAFGAAIRFLMGPIGWVTAGIGLLVGAVVGIVKWFNRSSAEAKRLKVETEKLGEETDALVDSIDESSDAYKSNQDEIKNSAKVNSDLAKKIEELSEKENKSAADKALLNSYIQELNSSVDDLNLAYDEEADALSMSSEEMQARINLMKEQETAQEAQSRLTEILKEQEEVEAQLADTIAKRKEAEDNGNLSRSEKKEITEDLIEQEKLLTEALEDLGEQQEITEEQIVTATENVTQVIEENNLRQITSYEELEGAQKEAFDSMKATYDELVDSATNAFDKISTESEISLSDMIENLEHNQQAVEEWGENQAKLMEWASKEGHENFMQWVEQLGPDHAGELAMLVENLESSNDDQRRELEKLAETYENGADVATDALKNSLGDGFDEAVDVMVHFVDDGSKTLRDQIKKSGFDEIGSMIPEGLVDGVEGGTPQAEEASKKLAKGVADSFKAQARINSPSKEFEEFGGNITEGLVLGIINGTTAVIQAVEKMFEHVIRSSERSFQSITKGHDRAVNEIERSLKRLPIITQMSMSYMLTRLKNGSTNQVNVMRKLAVDLIRPFNSTPIQLNSVGRNAMAGLKQGLLAGRGQVMSTARSIANSVASTMKSALRIHSPSRLMRDDVGRFIPEGIALGIRENAKSVYKELETLSDKMVMTSTPEQALGTSRMAYTNTGNQVAEAIKGFKLPSTGNSSQGITDQKQPAIINVYVGTKKLASELVDDITKLQDRSKIRKNRRPKPGGA